MTTPRWQLVSSDTPQAYHIVSRCVRRGWLCGFDRLTRRDYSHRKEWLLARLNQLGQAFAVDIYAYTILSNHFHLVLHYDPTAPARWSDVEVTQRWLRVCPPKPLRDGSPDEDLRQLRMTQLLRNPLKLEQIRTKLGSLSVFMKLLKQPIARRANLEDDCAGHFFEQRFYSGALLSNEAILAAMAYVDLNPVRAKIAQTIAECEHTSIEVRLSALEPLEANDHAADPAAALEDYLRPVISGVEANPGIQAVTLAEYVDRLEILTKYYQTQQTPLGYSRWGHTKFTKWHSQVAALSKRQRAFGSSVLIEAWHTARGWQMRDTPLPE